MQQRRPRQPHPPITSYTSPGMQAPRHHPTGVWLLFHGERLDSHLDAWKPQGQQAQLLEEAWVAVVLEKDETQG